MKSKLFIPCVILIVFSLGFSYSANAQEELNGEINWVSGYVSGIGYGTAEPSENRVIDKLKALRAAKVLAQRDLLENIKGVRVDSRTTVENMMVKEDIIRTRVEGTIKGARVVKRYFKWMEGNVPLATVEMRVYLSSSMDSKRSYHSLVNTLNLEHKYNAPPVPLPSIPKQAASSGEPKISYDSGKPVTGVVINLGGRFFERVLLPVVGIETKDKKPVTIYSVKSVDPKVIRTYGVVRYSDTVNAARKISYLGNNILIVPATLVTNDNKIIIGREGARTIKETIRYDNNYLEDAKIAIASH